MSSIIYVPQKQQKYGQRNVHNSMRNLCRQGETMAERLGSDSARTLPADPGDRPS